MALLGTTSIILMALNVHSTVNTQDQARFGPPRSCNLENKGVATGLMVCGGDSKVYSVSVVQTVSSTT